MAPKSLVSATPPSAQRAGTVPPLAATPRDLRPCPDPAEYPCVPVSSTLSSPRPSGLCVLGCDAGSDTAAIHDPTVTRLNLERILRLHERIRDLRVEQAVRSCGLSTDGLPDSSDGLDRRKMRWASALARLPGMTMERLVRLIRGESEADPRPNKALRPTDYRWLLAKYEHCELMVASASHGLSPAWLRSSPNQETRPKNHQSANRYAFSVARSVRSGQDGGQYLVVEEGLLESWPSVQVSPLGAVEKSGVDPNDEVRLIHDLKRPIGSSTNEATDRSTLPALTYRPVADLARRIEQLYATDPRTPICMLKGDVKGAFRHLMLEASSTGWMGARLADQQALLVDLSAPFGWTSSPTYYGVYGGAITWLVRRESPASLDPTSTDSEAFYAYEWVDDHVLIEHATDSRLQFAAAALRSAMMAVLGPRALNEKKFSEWSPTLEVLGLEFDTARRTVSMPERKIVKACTRIQDMQRHQRTTRSALRQLLGSLRHVCTCMRAVKPFFQRVQGLCNAAPSYGTIAITTAVRRDLDWCLQLLESGQFRDLPTSMFNAWPDPDIHLYMDASNAGLAVLDPVTRRYIQVKFDAAEAQLIASVGSGSSFTINVREQLSVAYAALIWGPHWSSRFRSTMGQVWCWIDNTTAVAVSNKLSSRNEMAQELNRWIGYAEAVYGFRLRCLHLPGDLNTMADAASRAWTPPHTNTWHVMKQGWTQDPVPSRLRRIYEPDSSTFSGKAWLPLALFAIYCWSRPPVGLGNAPDTVLSKISAISWYHRLNLGYSVGLHPGHHLAVQGMRRLSAPPAARAPTTIPVLHALRSRCDFSLSHDRVLWGAALLGHFYLLRSSEYLAVNGTIAATAITVADITFRDSTGQICRGEDSTRVAQADVRLRGSKTDQEGRTKTLSLTRSGSGWLCPVLAVLDLVEHARVHGVPQSAPLTTTSGGKPVKASALVGKQS